MGGGMNEHKFPYKWTLKDAVLQRIKVKYLAALLAVEALQWVTNLPASMF